MQLRTVRFDKDAQAVRAVADTAAPQYYEATRAAERSRPQYNEATRAAERSASSPRTYLAVAESACACSA